MRCTLHSADLASVTPSIAPAPSREFRGRRFQAEGTDSEYPELTVLQDFVCDANPDLMFYIVEDTIFIHLPRQAQ